MLLGVERSTIGKAIRRVWKSGELLQSENIVTKKTPNSFTINMPVRYFSLQVLVRLEFGKNLKVKTQPKLWAL